MKKVIGGEELQDKMLKAIHLLCDTVKMTLGPKGSNVLISSEESSPYITNDGVTIARNIESDDAVMDAILEIAKESSLKTNAMVGDGTTTTLVLLEKIMESGLKIIQTGYNEIVLCQEMEKAICELEKELEKEKKPATKKDFLKVAQISANDKELGNFVYEVFSKVKEKKAIKLIETNHEESTFELFFGYFLDLSSPYALETTFSSYILLVDGDLDSLEEFGFIMNAVIHEKKNLVVLANSFSNEMKQEATAYNLEEETKIILLETPEYANRSFAILKDLENFTHAKIWEKCYEKELSWKDLGYCEQVEWRKHFVLFSGKATKEYLQGLETEYQKCESSYEQEFIEERYAKLKSGLAIIWVGGRSRVSIREKKMRMEDALCALESTKKGVLPGGGISLLKLKDSKFSMSQGLEVILSALEAPFLQILENAGLDSQDIYVTLKKDHYQSLYNVKFDRYEKIEESSLKDPYAVVCTSLKNAISIASMLLTTKYLVLKEKEREKIFPSDSIESL